VLYLSLSAFFFCFSVPYSGERYYSALHKTCAHTFPGNLLFFGGGVSSMEYLGGKMIIVGRFFLKKTKETKNTHTMKFFNLKNEKFQMKKVL